MPHSQRSANQAMPGATAAALAGALLLLAVSVATGGSSQESGVGLLLAQWLSLPLIAWAGYLLLSGPAPGIVTRAWLVLAAALLAVPLLQLLPLQGGGAGRAALADDLALFGVEGAARLSLLPGATLASAVFLLPALAVFGLVLVLPAHARRWVAAAIVALAMASVLLGLAQLGAPQESVLNPYPQWRPAMGGFFANPNHQATLLVVTAVFASAWVTAALGAWPADRPHRMPVLVGSACLLLLALVALPLTGSRAGLVIGVLACGVVVAVHLPAWRGGRATRVGLVASTTVAGLGLLAGIRWMRVAAVEDLRDPLRSATAGIGNLFAPAGSGMGSFVRVFEQEAPTELLLGEYINHAHNEYAQWWLEAGIPALLVMALGAAVLALTLRALLRLPAQARAPGLTALVAFVAIMAHSLVDYPLRTPALLTVAAALAGMVAAATSRPRRAGVI